MKTVLNKNKNKEAYIQRKRRLELRGNKLLNCSLVKKNTLHLKAFTIAEVMITLALTSLAVGFAYSTLNYMQQLFATYKLQNRFINECTSLKQRLDFESAKCDMVTEEQANVFKIQRDTTVSYLKLLDQSVVMIRLSQTDTFHLKASKITKQFEVLGNPKWNQRLINGLSFETEFTKQKFKFYFYKPYDAAIKLALEMEH